LKRLTWRELNHVLASKTEDEVLQMLNEERVGTRRIVVLERLHQRYNTLRVSRERVELLNGRRIEK
jgi:hypothetical protein